ncbi:BON domain-containing protein [Azoarcus indigens]|uniref:BON domain-containing protein n=1 Tax=Azoarcus indigens TaxID=29545 RepID=A0A4R6ECH0_9RHOO|nr:BON domain-containing protein [Azoarcus indigens]NMG64257.1 BON domain-containing protein [Azoarcus indigens]TDN55850.1 BON domain-containing protein [Azoarcus indigens]
MRELIREPLTRMEELDVSDVSAGVNDARVTLEGTVPERGMKHAIEDAAHDCWGVRDVINRIPVAPRAGQRMAGGQGAGPAGAARRLAADVARGQRKG